MPRTKAQPESKPQSKLALTDPVHLSEAIRQYQSGKNLAQVGQYFGVSGQYVGRVFKKHKIPRHIGGYGDYLPAIRKRHRTVLQHWQDGYSVPQIARMTGYTAGGADYIIRKAGLIDGLSPPTGKSKSKKRRNRR
jgi:YesN/AraC family two-component response regulator